MKKTSQFIINAKREDVYSVFMDPMKLAVCIPGCKKIRGISPTQYEALVEVKVQFVPIKIQARGELKEAIENERIVVEMTGKPVGLAGSFSNTLTVTLQSDGSNKTKVDYELDLKMTGKLAAIGDLIMKGSSSKNSTEFVKNVQELFQHS
nr:SRPBCC domain-containing protein [Fredinandcohnia sp. SECRCQ15]